jgi:recombination protein RecT
MITKFKAEIERALPKHLNPDRMCRIALTEFRKNKKLADCDPRSVFAAVIQSAQLGLEVGLMGEASLVPFDTECQLIPGYTGLMKLARNTGKVKDIYAHEVMENDEFELTFGLERTLRHVPLKGSGGFPANDEKRGPVVGYYAVAVLSDGSTTFQAMSIQEVEKIRNASRGYISAKKYSKKSPWDTYPVEMGKKTVIRRLCKYLPKSPELAEALALDTAVEVTGKQSLTVDDAINGTWSPDYTETIDIEASEPKDLKAKLKAKLSDAPPPTEPADPPKAAEPDLPFVKTLGPDDDDVFTKVDPEPDPWTSFRESFINLKGAGFSTFVFKNLEKIKDCPVSVRDEVYHKWTKLYPHQPCPSLVSKPEEYPVAPMPTTDPAVSNSMNIGNPGNSDIPISYTPEYKRLIGLREQFPEYYQTAKERLNVRPDSVINCVNLAAYIDKQLEADIQDVQDESSAPDETDTSGF